MIIQYQIFCDAKAKKGHDMFSVPSVSVKLRKHTPFPLTMNYFFLFGCESSPISRNVRALVRPSVSPLDKCKVKPIKAQ